MVTGRDRPVLTATGLLLAGVTAIATALALAPDGLADGPRLAITMLRAAIVVSGTYVVLLGGLSLVAELFGWSRALRWSLRLGAARLGLAAGVAVASLGAATASTPSVGAVETDATSATTDTLPVATLTPIEPPVASLVPLASDTAAEPSGDQRPTWTVEQGDHLWAIAEAQVGDTDDHAVHDYWIRLIELNRDRFVVPEDPDLILPGQELLLPDR